MFITLTVGLRLPYSITQSKAACHNKEVRNVRWFGAPQPQHNEEARIEGGTGGDEGESFDVPTGEAANHNTAYRADGPKTDHDWSNTGDT